MSETSGIVIHTDKLLKAYIKIRDQKTEESRVWGEREAKLNGDLKAIELELLRRSQEEGVTGYKVAGVGTAFQATTTKVSIADDAVFYQFVKDTGDLDFLERRVSSKHVTEYMAANDGRLPPGINTFRELNMRIRRGDK
jgi:hypothetical protein